MNNITYADIRTNKTILTYIHQADEFLKQIGYTEHSVAHVTKVADRAYKILKTLNKDERECELAQISGFMHDIGNVINRIDHAQSGAVMAFRILDNMGMDPNEIAVIINAIGNHDEHTSFPVNNVSAALILADKTDVRRSRVRNHDVASFDIHDRVNYAVESSEIEIDEQLTQIVSHIKIDTDICAVIDYFEIFLGRMLLCKRAAEFLDLKFRLTINNQQIL